MNAARTWLAIFATGFVVLVALFVVTLLTPPAYPYGALTRIGLVSEQQFGWRTAPPPIPDDQVRSWPLEEADIVVVGDSFSMYHAWQAVLVGAGYRVVTAHWDKIGPLCEDFAPWLQRAGFRGRLVLVESIERLLPERLAGMRDCRAMRHPFTAMPTPERNPAQPAPSFALNWDAPLLTGIKTWRNTRLVREKTTEFVVDDSRRGDMIFAAPVRDGCAQFSHRLCDKGLFLIDDRHNPELSAGDAELMQRFKARAAPMQVVWMVIPNKTTVYLEPGRAQGFVQRARELSIGPDLFSLAQDLRRAIVDLYWPNDTHWSMQGQLAFGERMRDVVQATIGPARPERRSQ